MDLTDAQWAFLEPLFRPRRREDGRGRPWQDTRAVLNGVFWILRTGAPWHERSLHRRQLQFGEKRGCSVGPTKRGKGSKIMAIADRHGLPLAVHVASASPHETKLVERTIERRFLAETPQRLIGDRAYDSDPLDAHIRERFGVQMIAPHNSRRIRTATQDGRVLRRYRRRWKIERLFAWLHNYRRIVIRWEYHPENFLGMVQLACAVILLRHL
jgi:transposase